MTEVGGPHVISHGLSDRPAAAAAAAAAAAVPRGRPRCRRSGRGGPAGVATAARPRT